MALYDPVQLDIDNFKKTFKVKSISINVIEDDSLKRLDMCHTCNAYGVTLNEAVLKMSVENGIIFRPTVLICSPCLVLCNREIRNRLPIFDPI